jgi:tRNA U34 5-methylaminomethyl-2-thiouridine-forming methyltransferase MnmC
MFYIIFVCIKLNIMIMSRLQVTDDGSHTLTSEIVGENYHSSYGAIQESRHIFIDAGLAAVDENKNKQINVLEVGIGTGLNLLLTYLWSEKYNLSIKYHGYEPFPISKEEVILLNYPEQLGVDEKLFFHIHDKIGIPVNLSDKFALLVNKATIQSAKLKPGYYDVIYFDAFSPDSQPEMWTTEVFGKIYDSLKSGGLLTTYSCKGNVKRSLKEAGFKIEKLPGPPGKREFLRAWKIR